MSKRQNGFGPALGESLQSFIFRVLDRNGYCDFSTIVIGGGWGGKPSVPFHARSEFEVIDQNGLFRLYEKIQRGIKHVFPHFPIGIILL